MLVSIATGDTGRVTNSPLRPDEAALFQDLIDYHEREALVGRLDDEFLVAFIGNDGDLTHPGLVGSRAVSMRTLRHFLKLQLIDVLTETDAALSFALSDDFRARWASLSSPAKAVFAVFISVAETQKLTLARPFRDLLEASGLRGYIVSDEPRPEGTWTAEEKVEAYLDRSDAMVVFATADVSTPAGSQTRPNIADEIGRARAKQRLRDRICVLKEHDASLHSNVSPAYDGLDPEHPLEGFRHALRQLQEWGLPVTLPDVAVANDPSARDAGQGVPKPHTGTIFAVDAEALIARATGLIPDVRHTRGEPSLGVVVVVGPRQPILRPAELEDPALARELTQELLFGDAAIFDSRYGTEAAMSGPSLVVKQSASWMALDGEGSVVVVRPLWRGGSDQSILRAVIDEDVRADIENVLRFIDRLLTNIDRNALVESIAPIAALIGSSYGSWRTRAEQTASPTSMAMNITNGDDARAQLTPAVRPRAELGLAPAELAADLAVLLRRQAVR